MSWADLLPAACRRVGRSSPLATLVSNRETTVYKLIHATCKGLNLVMAVLLAIMVVLVFGNVVLRYAANSGWTVTEELARWLFVWLTFLGSVVAIHDRAQLGMDSMVARLPKSLQRANWILVHVLMLVVCGWLFIGTWKQLVINLTTTSAVMEVSMAWFYAAGLSLPVLGGPILLHDLYLLLTGRALDPVEHDDDGTGTHQHS